VWATSVYRLVGEDVVTVLRQNDIVTES
jgi:hypothetical protein